MREPRRILVVRLSALGDVLLATPAVRALKKRFPNAEIDWLVESGYLPLLEENPHARPVPYDKGGRHRRLAGLLTLREELERGGYDLVIDLQNKAKTWLLRGVADHAVSLKKRAPGEALQALFGKDAILTRAHAVDLFLEALQPLGVTADGSTLDLVLSQRSRDQAEALGLPANAVGLAPGARWETKRWPAERFAALATSFAAQGLQLVLIGGPGDREALAAVRAALPSTLQPKDTSTLGVGGLAAAIAGLKLLVAGDSGPVHIASAVGTPVLAIFGPTSPLRWRPLGANSAVVKLELPCSPCSNHGTVQCPLGHHQCMKELGVAQVLEAAQKLVG